MNPNAIIFSEYSYNDLKEDPFSDRLKKARLIAGYSQNELSKLVKLSKSYINDFEVGTQTHISKGNILKLHEFLYIDLVMNDYIYFVLNQNAILKDLLNKYQLPELAKLLLVHESTIQNGIMRKFKYQLIILIYLVFTF
ncbi:helix-turn-helix domain-containing protein [Clostridium perfringens]|uniref:helix-turn-helix domain-containing protein n=1 Tax=Clostridium perfringens TaxID=1502 RepID=UPI001A338DA0|nr:helix-turn-helix transcriptional regulator [Clostridium perfringens]HAT4071064.1 helix-turn-helix transcriptional regulator [Clostridium perfringens]